MRLLHVQTGKLEEFAGDDVPPYAILSHTWGKHELTLQDLSKLDRSSIASYAKVEGCCRQAANEGLHYVWIDTCCIDKTSSAELSEGINSMFQWYRKSTICYVYLADVTAEDDPFDGQSEFRRSRWFERGWTLQELLAPMEVAFFDRTWNELVTGRLFRSPHLHPPVRLTLLILLSEITNIPEEALETGDFSQFCAAARLAWAADRNTTRLEDRAYSLLGLLEVHMPLLYGEGNKAFQRLQEEVIKSRDDDSLLAWGYGLVSKIHPTVHTDSVLAQSPSDFRHCHNFRRFENEGGSRKVSPTTSHSAMTNIGMQMTIPVRPIDSRNGTFMAILRGHIMPDRHWYDESAYHLVIPLVRTKGGNANHFSRAPGSSPFLISRNKLRSILQDSKLFFLLGRMPLLWKLLVTQPLPTPIYLRAHPTLAASRALSVPWPQPQKKWKSMHLHIDEVASMGYEVVSFHPPWITESPGNSNVLVLRLGSKSTRFIILFSNPDKPSLGNGSFAVCIGQDTHSIAQVDQGSALEHLMEQSRNLKFNAVRHNIRQKQLQLKEEGDDGNCVRNISFQDIFGDVRIKCSISHTSDGDISADPDRKAKSIYSEGKLVYSPDTLKEHIGVAL
ncbi:HET-domain-containing protein [Hypoxylon sp. FL1150]|nr:HET-domain-containing protein [Hypoxylon sp. FL1150]